MCPVSVPVDSLSFKCVTQSLFLQWVFGSINWIRLSLVSAALWSSHNSASNHTKSVVHAIINYYFLLIAWVASFDCLTEKSTIVSLSLHLLYHSLWMWSTSFQRLFLAHSSNYLFHDHVQLLSRKCSLTLSKN